MIDDIRRIVLTSIQAAKARDTELFKKRMANAFQAAKSAPPAQLTAIVDDLAPLLPEFVGLSSKMALFLGALVEWGASPSGLCPYLPARASESLEGANRFVALWLAVHGGYPPQSRNSLLRQDLDSRQIKVAAAGLGMTPQDVQDAATAWFELESWTMLLTTTLARRPFRIGMSDRTRLAASARNAAHLNQQCAWVWQLLQVLDDEPLIVVDATSNVGWRLTMGGIGDNYQLHTLLADRLIGDPADGLLPGERPRQDWVAAATEGAPAVAGGVARRFRLFDGQGNYVAPEGLPADVSKIQDRRVLVILPELGNYRWANARVFTGMEPTLTLDRPLTQQEIDQIKQAIPPLRQTDLFAP